MNDSDKSCMNCRHRGSFFDAEQCSRTGVLIKNEMIFGGRCSNSTNSDLRLWSQRPSFAQRVISIFKVTP